MFATFNYHADENSLTKRVVVDTGIQDILQRRMCHHMVMYACQVMRVLAEYYVRGANARYEAI